MEWTGRGCTPATLRSRRRRREHCDVLNHPVHGLITAAPESDSVPRVSDTAPQLPVDIEALQALLAAARAQRDAAIADRDRGLSQNDRLPHLLRQLPPAQIGRRPEKL